MRTLTTLASERVCIRRGSARIAWLMSWAVAGILASVLWVRPLHSQSSPPALRPLQLFTRPPGSTAQDPRTYLAPSTEVRVFRENAPNATGREVHASETPVTQASMILDSVSADSGTTAKTYEVDEKNSRYFVYAFTPDNKLYWSVDAQRGATPRFHTLDSPALIRMAEVPIAARNRLQELFPGGVTVDTMPDDTTVCDSSCGALPPPPERFDWLWILSLAGAAILGWIVAHLELLGRLASLMTPRSRRHDTRMMSMPRTPPVRREHTVMSGASGESSRREDDFRDTGDELTRSYIETRLEKLERHITDTVSSSDELLIRSLPPQIVSQLVSQAQLDISPRRTTESNVNPNSGGERVSTRANQRGSQTQQIADIFLEWCRNAGGNLGRLQLFGDKLKSYVSSAEVQEIKRDRDSNVVTFVTDIAGDPIEYWMVTLNRVSMLFPRPLTPQRFKELDPVFEGEAAPQTLRSIDPALVHQEGNRWVLDKPGQVS
jgi:hypothetical protein